MLYDSNNYKLRRYARHRPPGTVHGRAARRQLGRRTAGFGLCRPGGPLLWQQRGLRRPVDQLDLRRSFRRCLQRRRRYGYGREHPPARGERDQLRQRQLSQQVAEQLLCHLARTQCHAGLAECQLGEQCRRDHGRAEDTPRLVLFRPHPHLQPHSLLHRRRGCQHEAQRRVHTRRDLLVHQGRPHRGHRRAACTEEQRRSHHAHHGPGHPRQGVCLHQRLGGCQAECRCRHQQRSVQPVQQLRRPLEGEHEQRLGEHLCPADINGQ